MFDLSSSIRARFANTNQPPPPDEPEEEEEGDPIGDALRADAVAYWKLDEASGNRLDSKNGHDLVPVNGITQIAGKIGNAIHADALQGYDPETEQYLVASAHADLAGGNNQSFAFAGWIWVDNFDDDSPSFFSRGEDVSLEYRLFATTLYLTFAIGGDISKDVLHDPITAGAWHFIVAWYDASTFTSYLQVDGGTALADGNAGISPGVTVDPTANTLVGANYQTDPSSFLSGRVDELGFWHRVLTSDERAYLYNAGEGRTLYP